MIDLEKINKHNIKKTNFNYFLKTGVSTTNCIFCSFIPWHITAYILKPMPRPYCLADHKVLSTLEKPRESASAPTLEAAMPETSHRSSVSSMIRIPGGFL